MDKVVSRRVAPMGWVTAIVVAVLFLFELLVIGGAIELRTGTVAKYAPWAYEPFLRLVGEHPESESIAGETPAGVERSRKSSGSALAQMTGITSDIVQVELDIAEPVEEVLEPEPESEPEPEPVKEPAAAVPVG